MMAVAAVVFALMGSVPAATAAPAPVGNGFVVNEADIAFILKQIVISEHHAATQTPTNMCGTLVGPAADQIPDRISSYGLRTVDGSCNNLFPGRETFAAADQVFPRLTTPTFRTAEDPPGPGFPPANASPSTYAQPGNVFDSGPRTVSNLIVDQTSTNPAAVAAAGNPVRSQDPTASAFPCTTDPVLSPDGTTVVTPGKPAGCVPSHETLFIPNVTTDVGLSPPYNSLFTFFGQFFDHGVDQTVKTGATVFVPLRADDPLIAGKDHILGNADDLPANQRFMVLTRAQVLPGPDGVLGTADDGPSNTDSPWVDQSQTYTSHSSHQVFLREYTMVAGHPVSTGKFLGGLPAGQTYPGSPDGTDGISTWASVKKQAAEKLGLLLQDKDVTNIPMLAVDPYGNFLPGPNGLPQYATATGTVEGNLANPVAVPANVLHFDTPFLTDIAHNADPSPDPRTGASPTPDSDNTPSADFAHQPPGTYDNELLDAHFACGDGRCNENIALSSIHQVFHSEHNRLVDDILTTLNKPANAALLASYNAPHLVNGVDVSFGFGGRLFQAARFVTEMEYQHLVFEEFARKVQPAIRPFHVYSPDINPAIEAEFAHAVYRFGHSMLDDQVARSLDPATGGAKDTSLPLLTAFLNPPMYFNTSSNALGNPNGSTYTPQQAAGAIVMGSSDQTGNELDEFVTETLRNNLLGLPLDLPTINMTRAREAGVPPLNEVRRQIFAQTNDGQLAPYANWSDFGQHLKHPESLVNFVAAYGTHPSITGASTLEAKRAAARAIVDPFPGQAATPGDPTANPPIPATDAIPADVVPADAADFMFGTGAWADSGGKTTTGLDDVDLWVGGLAEVTNLFGGLLGSTFNYVFQTQLEKLQDGDRLYYLARTPGMNLRTQLEGNSFSEMIQRNTDGTNTLKADAFATADCKFQLADLTFPAAAGSVRTGADSINDVAATTDCNENLLLRRDPGTGRIEYIQRNTVDPAGINGQSVYNGTPGADRINGGNDNDTFWGGLGNDVIDGQGGDDVVLGGEGNDIITDLDGADTPKGGPGNDAIDAGPGDDIPMGNAGQDFINGGANDNETFAGPGNDFVIAGQGADAVFGDSGDDWIEGGSGQDLLQGDHGAPFFDDPAQTAPGNDVFIDQVGESDYDAEGGDDVMAQNVAVDRNAGAGGFDWAFHQFDIVAPNTSAPPADDDMMINNNLGGLPIQIIVNRDRWQETEADSGGPGNDTIKGTDGVLSTPRLISGGGFTGCDALDQAGVARITGLSDLLPPVAQWVGTAAETSSLSVSGYCPLTGPVWGEGDILLGGPGSDTITGRTGDEIIDGDKELRVAISVRTDPTNPATEVGRTDLMENKATSGTFGTPAVPVPASMTLQQAVFAGLVDPGNLVAVREIVNKETNPADCAAGTAAKNCDTATFAGPLSQYTITNNANGSVTVADNTSAPATVAAPATGDGRDTLFNVEQLKFADQTLLLAPPVAPTITSVVAGSTQATVNFSVASATGIASFTVKVFANGTLSRTITGVSASARSLNVTGLTNGTPVTFTVTTVNTAGLSAESAPSTPVTPTAPVTRTVPAAPTGVAAIPGNAQAAVSWTLGSDGGSPLTEVRVQVRTGTTVVRNITGLAGTATSTVVTGLTNGTAYNFRVRAVNAVGVGAFSAASTAVTPTAGAGGGTTTAPATPTIGTAAAGNAQATVRWTAGTGGGTPASFQVQVRTGTGGATLVRTVTGIAATATSNVVTGLTNGTTYMFRVVAVNAVGSSAASALSNTVTPATVPGAPVIGLANPGAAGGTLTASVNWAAPINTGGASITSYTVRALRMSANGAVLSTTTFTGVAATARTLSMTLSAGNYRFTVQAVNSAGASAQSARSIQVAAR
jgi:Ca2+-binding RTX toxin-like protein